MKRRRGNLPATKSISNNSSGESKEGKHPRTGRQSSPYYWSRLLAGALIGLLLGFILFKRHSGADDLDIEPDAVLRIVTSHKHDNTQHHPQLRQNHVIEASRNLFSTLPEQNKRTYYAQDDWNCQAMIRALRSIGWIRVAHKTNARLIYTNERHGDWYSQLEPWQRYNHLPEAWDWDNLERGFREYAKTFNRTLHFLPETFHLNVDSQVEQFRQRIFDKGGLNETWLLKEPNGGVTMLLAPNSEDLKDPFQKAGEDPFIVQQYICNVMTVRMYVLKWEQRKLSKLRVYWFVSVAFHGWNERLLLMRAQLFHPFSTFVYIYIYILQVASMDPLIVLYMDGYVRIGNATHDEKASFAHFGEILRQHHDADNELQKRIVDPITHVRNQCKESLSLFVDAFKNKTFQRGSLMSEDAFELYSADYIVDNDFDIWLLDVHDDKDMDGT